MCLGTVVLAKLKMIARHLDLGAEERNENARIPSASRDSNGQLPNVLKALSPEPTWSVRKTETYRAVAIWKRNVWYC
jgi:hypothetical protein